MVTTLEKPATKHSGRGLGKGLSALMGEAAYDPPKSNPQVRKGAIADRDGLALTLSIDDLQPGKYQPREFFSQVALMELAESIRKNGLVQPLVVRQMSGGKYEIIAGERRWRAAGIAGLRSLPVIVRVLDDKQALETALIENVQREDLNPLEEAAGYQRLMFEFTYTQDQLATVVHKSRSHIANLLRLLELPEEIRHLLLENRLSMGHARALAGVPNNTILAQEVVQKGLSVRQTEKLVSFGKKPSEYKLRKQQEKELAHKLAGFATEAEVAKAAAQNVQPSQRDPDIMALEETLSENLGLKVSINDRGQSGEIMIAYESLEQLDDILRRLGGSI